MRLEDVTALQAISIIVNAKGLFMDKIDNVYYIKPLKRLLSRLRAIVINSATLARKMFRR